MVVSQAEGRVRVAKLGRGRGKVRKRKTGEEGSGKEVGVWLGEGRVILAWVGCVLYGGAGNAAVSVCFVLSLFQRVVPVGY